MLDFPCQVKASEIEEKDISMTMGAKRKRVQGKQNTCKPEKRRKQNNQGKNKNYGLQV